MFQAVICLFCARCNILGQNTANKLVFIISDVLILAGFGLVPELGKKCNILINNKSSNDLRSLKL